MDEGKMHPTFEKEVMFGQCKFCKLFLMEAPRQTGEVLHAHDYYQVWYVVRGCCDHYVEGQSHKMKVGDAFILPPNLLHETHLGENGKILCCEFSMDDVLYGPHDAYFRKMSEITNGMSFMMLFQQDLHDARLKFTFSTETQRKIEQLLFRMLEEYQNAELLYEDFLQLQIQELLLLFIREYAQSPSHQPSEEFYCRYKNIVQDVIVYINQHYSDPLTLEDMCRLSMMSKTYFCYLFKIQTKKTFVEYLVDLRVAKASELLEHSAKSITEISQEVGFQDSTHFARTFKKIKGLTPREYRRGERG